MVGRAFSVRMTNGRPHAHCWTTICCEQQKYLLAFAKSLCTIQKNIKLSNSSGKCATPLKRWCACRGLACEASRAEIRRARAVLPHPQPLCAAPPPDPWRAQASASHCCGLQCGALYMRCVSICTHGNSHHNSQTKFSSQLLRARGIEFETHQRVLPEGYGFEPASPRHLDAPRPEHASAQHLRR